MYNKGKVDKTGFNSEIYVIDEDGNLSLIHPSQIPDDHNYKTITFDMKSKEFKVVPFGKINKVESEQIYQMSSNKFKPTIYVGNKHDLVIYNILNSRKNKNQHSIEYATNSFVTNAKKVALLKYNGILNIFKSNNLLSDKFEYNSIDVGVMISNYIINRAKGDSLKKRLSSVYNVVDNKHDTIEDEVDSQFDHDILNPFIEIKGNKEYKKIPLNVITMPKFLLGLTFGLLENCEFVQEQDRGNEVYYLKCYIPKYIAEMYSKILNIGLSVKSIVKADTVSYTDRKHKKHPSKRWYISMRINDSIMMLLKSANDQNIASELYQNINDYIEANKVDDPNIEKKVIFNPFIYTYKCYELILNQSYDKKHIKFEEVSDEEEIELYSIEGIDTVVTESCIVVGC